MNNFHTYFGPTTAATTSCQSQAGSGPGADAAAFLPGMFRGFMYQYYYISFGGYTYI